MNNLNKITIFGLGYIGLPTACMFANNGFEVLGIDINDDIINKLQNGKLHIEEPELEKIFLEAFNNKKLSNSKQIAIIDIMKEKNMIQISTTVRVLSHDKPNNILKFILTDRREIVVDFYFSKKCQNNMVKTKKGMMYVQAEKLCEELADEKIE